MTASGGDSGEKPHNEGWQAPSQAPSEGTYEAPPIEQTQGPGGYEAPGGFPPPEAPAYTGYEAPSGFPPPDYPPPSYPPPGGYAPQPGYQPPTPPPGDYNPQYGASYPPPPPPPQQYGAQPYPGGYNYGAPPAGTPQDTNTMAIGSLVASVVGLLCGIGSIIGIVLGIVALNQIKQTRQEGYGLAMAGIVVGVASLIISGIWTIYAFS